MTETKKVPEMPKIPVELNEAGGSVNTIVYGKKEVEGQTFVVQFSVTCRGIDGIQAFDNLMATLKHARETYGLSTERPDQGVFPTTKSPADPTVPQGSQVPQTPTNPFDPQTPQGPQTPQTPTNVPGIQVLKVVKMEIAPKPDGKVTLNLFGEGHNFPDLYTTRTVDKAIELLKNVSSGITPEFLSKVGSYPLRTAFRVEWKYSEKTNGKGNPYKDIISIQSWI